MALRVSVLFNEPKLLKFNCGNTPRTPLYGFSALQRAEIAEIANCGNTPRTPLYGFSALQRAEIAEIA